MNAQPAQIRDFLEHRQRVEVRTPGLTQAGVLIPLFPKEGKLSVVLTKRTVDVEHHKGQISFPGGSVDSSDKNIMETALREAQEEIGLPKECVEILGIFDDFWTPSGFRITPVIGFIAVLPTLTRNKTEVEEILEVPISFFLDRTNERIKKFKLGDKEIDVYFYTHGGKEIWGATAAILRSFLTAFQSSI